jgi:hypothetical protein
MVMGRIQEKIQAKAKACATGAPQEFREHGTPIEQKVRLTIRLEAQALAHAIECRFVRTGKIELPEGQIEAPARKRLEGQGPPGQGTPAYATSA